MATETITIELSEYQALIEAAYYDQLTGCANRRKLEADYTPGVHVILCDLNKFKPVNDIHGHDAGDKVLVEFAQALTTLGAAYRLGGDEFVLLTTDLAALDAISAWVGSYEVTASAGVATGDTLADCLKAADAAMYAEKGHARR